MATTFTPLNHYFDLTQSQLLFWAGQQLNPASPLYNMTLSFDLKGAIDPAHFQSAFQTLIDQTDALRTVFEEQENTPKQRILSTLVYPMEVLDVSDTPEPAVTYREWAKQRSQRPFDLSACTFDAVLVKLAADRYAWFFNQHHLTTDAWSVSVLYKQLARLYQNSLEGNSQTIPTLPSFTNYVDFEKAVRANPDKAALHEYWNKKAAQLPPLPRLYGQKKSKTSASERIFLNLGKERSERLRTLVQEKELRSWTQHMSLFQVFATTLFSLLYRVSGQKKLAIGTPAHNRPTADFKETPGVFINVLPMIAEVAEDDDFLSLFQKVRNEAFEFLRYAEPGTGNPQLSRGFNVVLNYIHATFSDFNTIPMTSEWVHPGHCDPQHHLRLQVHDFDNSGAIELNFDLNTDIFDETQQETVPAHFLQLLDAFIADYSQKVAAVPLVSKQELEQQAQIFQGEKLVLAESNILNLFERQALQTPRATALSFQTEKLDYATLNQRANQLARFLRQKGVKTNSRVGIYFKRSPDLLISILAVMKAGATYVPIEFNAPQERLAHIIQDAAIELVLTTTANRAKVKTTTARLIALEEAWSDILKLDATNLSLELSEKQLVYILYTSGSTGFPKGVMISHGALANYIQWAQQAYNINSQSVFALFTMIGFDLTVTSLFVPLVSGGQIRIYEENETGPDLALFEVMKENVVNCIKLTPAHLELMKNLEVADSQIELMIVGGEDFKATLASEIDALLPKKVAIYNEYGPTEATVGCVVHRFDPQKDTQDSVPIGRPIGNASIYILDEFKNPVPNGVTGELYISGAGVAEGYLNQPELNTEKFLPDLRNLTQKMYRTGDLVRVKAKGILDFLGRKDQQVKIGGMRVELGEIETALLKHPKVQTCVVDLRGKKTGMAQDHIHYCTQCGLPSNYPGATYDEEGVCHLCQGFTSYKKKVAHYFKTMDDLHQIFATSKGKGEYDCIMLLSGGKDSTYALGQLIEMGLRVLAFTLDNGYISEQAKDNVRRVVKELGVDHVFGETPAMNAIFVDSLERHCNVCNGCFKTIYTLSMKLALEKGIPYIVTGLSRGQFFETRLTEELFWNEEVDIDKIDQIILNSRKAYHRVDDAVKQLMDVSVFEDDRVFEQVQFVDFYRYTDVSLNEMLAYLDQRLPWERPTDTGRSTNCLINQVGIYVHKKERGYNNYAFPYSWDVRVGHKQREAALEEINEEVNETEVQQIIEEIGYQDRENDANNEAIYAYFTVSEDVTATELREFLALYLPAYMIPTHFIPLKALPLTKNGKVDRKALQQLETPRLVKSQEYVAPSNEFEEMLVEIWSEVLQIPKIGVQDKFLEIGGTSLLAIRINARIWEAFELEIPVTQIFEKATIAALAEHLKNTLMALLGEMENDE